MIEVYHCKGARSLRTLWTLEELGLPYQIQLLGFPPRIKNPEFLRLNPAGTVPFLVDGGTTMRESVATLEYLAAKYGAGCLQVKPDEASFGAWLDWLHFGEATLTTALAARLRFTLFDPPELRIPRLGDDYANFYLSRLELLENGLNGREFLCADRFSIADISVGYALYLAIRSGLGERHSPAITAYWARLEGRPAFAAALRKREPAAAVGPS